MKHITHHIKKIRKNTFKRWATVLVLLFFAMTILFQKDVQTTELQFVWNMDETFIHNAPNTQRDYLFEDEWGETSYQWTLNATGTTTQPLNNDPLIDPQEIEQIIQENQEQTGQLYSWTITTGVQIPLTGTTTWTLNCITPRGETIKHKDFVLAYEQRKDVNSICNIEKRVCMSGILLWSFKQQSCRDDVVYEYRKAEVISYNQKVLNEYIQPKPPTNSWANFDTEGKIDTTEIPTTSRWTTNNPTETNTTVIQGTKTRNNCKTPRGQTIEHGQFTKAYKSSRGFINLPCEVELRVCVDGNLKGNFTYTNCTFNNTTYEDYLTAWSPISHTGFLFFERIKKIFSQ